MDPSEAEDGEEWENERRREELGCCFGSGAVGMKIWVGGES
jgi:hypothetical protein